MSPPKRARPRGTNLAATEIYTQVSIDKLKQVHSATHPGARLGGPPGSEEEGEKGGAAGRVKGYHLAHDR